MLIGIFDLDPKPDEIIIVNDASTEKIIILIKYPNALDKKYVWIPNIKIPTKHLKRPKNFDPLNPKDDLNKTTKGRPNF